MIIAIDGDVGAGKTLLATMLAISSIDYEHIVSNYKINSKRYLPFSISDFFSLKYQKSLIVLDEAYTLADARRSSNRTNMMLSSCIFQSRKMKCDLIFTCQILQTIDLRARYLIRFLISAEAVPDGFCYAFYKNTRRIGMNQEPVFKSLYSKIVPLSVAEKFFGYYNTYEIIKTDEQRIEMDFDKILERCIAYFKNDKHKLTKDYIRYVLIKNSEIVNTDLVSAVYYTLEEMQSEENSNPKPKKNKNSRMCIEKC